MCFQLEESTRRKRPTGSGGIWSGMLEDPGSRGRGASGHTQMKWLIGTSSVHIHGISYVKKYCTLGYRQHFKSQVNPHKGSSTYLKDKQCTKPGCRDYMSVMEVLTCAYNKKTRQCRCWEHSFTASMPRSSCYVDCKKAVCAPWFSQTDSSYYLPPEISRQTMYLEQVCTHYKTKSTSRHMT